MSKWQFDMVGTFKLPHLFAGEKLVDHQNPWKPKKQKPDNYSRFERWFLGIGSESDEEGKRKRWMATHHNGETHPIDLEQ